METGKPQSVSTLLYGGSVAVPTERKMDAQAPLTAVYIRAVPAPPPTQQLFRQAQFPVTPPSEHATLRLAMPPLYTKDTLPFLRVHIAGGLQPLRQELSLATAIPLAPVARPKSAGKHVCPHCSRDCMKPSVLEKHLRCHTGERPYPCTTCRVSFKTQSNLYKHKRTQAHARLSTESEKSTHSSMGSQESLCGSSVCSSSLDCQVDGESGSLDEEVGAFPLTKYSCTARLTEKVHCWEKTGTDPERGATGDPVQGKIDLSLATQKTETVQSPGLIKEEVKGKEGETKKHQGLTPNRHLPLQRQEATLFLKEWEGSALRGKPHSHESTDSGFSESTDHNMDPLPECITEHHDRPGGSQAAAAGLSQSGPDPRDIVSVREQRSLEEHISKLISENSVVVEDKQLENVRPRKTVLSKQGSIDLPMRYTYKDSFHFDMRNNPAPIAKHDGNRRPVLQSSLQPVRSASAEQAPLTRSSSLPYSVALLTPEQSTQSFSCPKDYVTLIRRGSAGPANPTAFSGKSVDQQLPAHRPLVRQAAVDCNHATEGLFFTNSSMERPAINSDLSCDGGGGSDICGAQSDRKRLRKKAQKFTYNKWHTYKGGTFKKLYNTTKGGDSVTSAAKEPSPLSLENLTVQSVKSLPGGHSDRTTTAGSTTSGVTVCHPSCLPANLSPVSGMELNLKSREVHQACSSPRPPPLSHVSLSMLHVSSNRSSENHNTDIIGRPAERPGSKEKHTDFTSPPQRAQIPSDRKKQRTNESTVVNPPRTEANHNTLDEPSSLVTDIFPTQNTNISQVSLHLDRRVDQHGEGILPQRSSASIEQTSVQRPTSVSLLSSTKTSFLPKYQLKLPTVTETRSTSSLHTLKLSNRNDGHGFTTSVSSSSINQHFLTSIGNSTLSRNECTLQPNMLSGNPQSSEETNSTQTVNKSLVTGVNHGANLALTVSQRHCTTITTATATMRSHHKELCSPTVIQTSPFKPVMAPHAEHLTRPVLQNQSLMTFTTGRQNSQSSFLSSSATTFTTTFSQRHRPNLSHTHPLRTLSSLSRLNQANEVSVGHTVPDLPFQMLPFDPGQLNPIQKVFHVQTADLQICLQIISDEQLALIESRMEKQAASSERRKKTQTQALNFTVPVAGAWENVAHQSMCDQREVDNMKIPPLPELQYMKLNSMDQADVSQAQVSWNTNVSWSLQPPVHPHTDANHSTATDGRCCTGGTAPTEALPKAVKLDTRKTQGESDRSFSASFAAKELGDATPLFPGELLQEESQGSQHTPLSQRAKTYTVEEVTGKLHDRVCAPTTSQGGEVKLLPQRSKERAWTHEKTGHNLHHPEGGPSLFPENNNKLCSASGEVSGGGGDDLVDPGTGHSDSRLQPLRCGGVGVPLIHSSSSRPTAPFDSADTPAGLAQPQPSGPTHEGSLLVGGLASQKAPDSQGRRSSPGQPDSAGPGLAQKSQEPREKDQQCVEEAAQSGAQVGAGTALGLPALPLSQTWRGMSAGPGSRPADGASRSHHTPAGDGVNPPQPATAATVNATRLCGHPGVGPDGRGQVCDQNPVSSPGVHSQHVCPAEPNSVCVQADHPHQNPMKTQEMTLKPTGVAQASTWDTVSTHSSDTPAPTQSPLSAMKPSPCPHLPETLQSTLPAHAPNNNNNNNSSSSGARAEEEKEEVPASKPREGEVEGGGVTREHVAYGGDPLGGDGGGFPSSRYHHHQEEEVVLSEAQLGGHQFTKVSSTANMWPLLPNCQGYQEDSSSDDDDEDKLIIEL